MRSLAMLMTVLAACGGVGAEIVITSEVPIDQVELFLADGDCVDDEGRECPVDEGVAWTKTQPQPPGRVFFMHGGNVARFDSNEMHDGAIGIRLELPADQVQPRFIAIVGYENGEAKAVGLIKDRSIPVNSAVTWDITLEAAAPAELSFEGPPGSGPLTRVKTWARDVPDSNVLSKCLAIQRWDTDAGKWHGTFIVPHDDPDCDGFTRATGFECHARHYDYEPMSPEPCLLTGSLSGECNPGAMQCIDGMHDEVTCNRFQHVCVVEGLCTKCAGMPDLAACARSALTNDPNDVIKHASCHFQAKSTGLPCTRLDGQGRTAFMYLPGDCPTVTSLRRLDERLLANTVAAPATVNGMTFEVVGTEYDGGSQKCAVTFRWSGQAQLGSKTWLALLATRVVSGQAVTTVVPVGFEILTSAVDCGNPETEGQASGCAVSPDLYNDSAFRCQ